MYKVTYYYTDWHAVTQTEECGNYTSFNRAIAHASRVITDNIDTIIRTEYHARDDVTLTTYGGDYVKIAPCES